MIPNHIMELLRFGGTTARSQQSFARQCGKAIRNAAAASVERSRRAVHEEWARIAQDRRHQKKQASKAQPEEVLRGDRGSWQGTPTDPDRVARQALAMEAKLVRLRARRAESKAREEEQARRDAAQAKAEGLSAAGAFTRVAKGDITAGGLRVEAAGPGTEGDWARWETPAGENRRWQTLERWWKWQTERSTESTAERFQSLVVAQDGVCCRRAQGRRCQQGGYRRHGIVLCGGCRATEKVLGCQVCGVAGDIHSPGWGAVG